MINIRKNNKYNVSILLLCIFIIIIYSILNYDNRVFIADLLSEDISLIIATSIISIIAYYDLLLSFIISIIYIIMLVPFFYKLSNVKSDKTSVVTNNKIKESFTTEKKEDLEEKDNVTNIYNAILGKGKRTTEFMKNLKSKKYKSQRESVLDTLKNEDNGDNTESFNDNEVIKKRKFNPNDELDNNLLMVIDICNDIKKRITYDYESIDYLKKYISSRLQEIINLLDLTSE